MILIQKKTLNINSLGNSKKIAKTKFNIIITNFNVLYTINYVYNNAILVCFELNFLRLKHSKMYQAIDI